MKLPFSSFRYFLGPVLVWASMAVATLVQAQANDAVLEKDLLGSVEAASGVETSIEKESNYEWLIAPIPSKNASVGWTLAAPVSVLYRPSFANPGNPPWITGLAGFYAENGSWGAGLFHRMNLQDDRWRIMAALMYSDISYKFYGIGEGAGDPDRYLDLNQVFKGGIFEGLRKVAPNTYLGLRFMEIRAQVESIGIPGENPIPLPPELGLSVHIRTFTPRLVYDSRDNEFYPTRGNLGKVDIGLSAEDWGSDYSYQLYSASWNHYRSLSDSQVLALRVAVKYADGRMPFFLLPAMGQGSDLRGYPPGVYRDRLLMAGQAEYRHRLTKRWGFVLFAGVGAVGSGPRDLGEALPSYGAGLRFVVAPENNVSMRMDVARGKHSTELYVSVGEAF